MTNIQLLRKHLDEVKRGEIEGFRVYLNERGKYTRVVSVEKAYVVDINGHEVWRELIGGENYPDYVLYEKYTTGKDKWHFLGEAQNADVVMSYYFDEGELRGARFVS